MSVDYRSTFQFFEGTAVQIMSAILNLYFLLLYSLFGIFDSMSSLSDFNFDLWDSDYRECFINN